MKYIDTDVDVDVAIYRNAYIREKEIIDFYISFKMLLLLLASQTDYPFFFNI